MKRSRYLLCAATVCGGLWTAAAAGDVVHLKNGNTLEGVVKEENDKVLVLSIGAGAVTLNRQSIDSVERGDTGANDRIRGEWQEKYFATPRFAPEPLRPLAESFLGLETSRRAAMIAFDHIRKLEQVRDRDRKQLAALHAKLGEAAAALQAAPVDANPRAYNEQVARNNALTAQIAALYERVRHGGEQAEQQRRTIADYMSQLAAFRSRFEEAKATHQTAPADSPEAVFFARMEEAFGKFESEVRSEEIPYESHGSHVIVKARINGTTEARLLLDTGASLVAISEQLATRLHLRLPVATDVTLTLAGGSTMPARSTVLDSVEVDGLTVQGVPAVVIAASGEDGNDGLLGMSFLREFQFQLDPVNHRLVLRRFRPD